MENSEIDEDSGLSTTEIALIDIHKKRKARLTIFRWSCFIAAFVMILWGISPFGHIAFNGSNSIDGSLFLVSKIEKPIKGELAAFHPPDGNLYPDEMWFGKYIVGHPGDVIKVSSRNVYINDNYIGYAKTHSSKGKILDVISEGVIPRGYYFMWTNHENSYDSRYTDIGLIHEKDIFGKLYRIF